LTTTTYVIQWVGYNNGDSHNMDAIDQALAQVRAEIEHIQRYLAQLQEAERELVTVRATRQNIVREWQFSDTRPSRVASPLPPPPGVQQGNVQKAQQPLAKEILQLLRISDHAMTPIEIDRILRNAGREMHVNAVTSTLARLAKTHEVVRAAGAKYSLPAQSGDTGDQHTVSESLPVRPTSIAGQAYSLLKRIGRPLTGEEIAAHLQAEGEPVNPRSVVTALYHSAQDNQLFQLVKSKTFGLLEWGQAGTNITSSHGEGGAIKQERELVITDKQQQWRDIAENEHAAPSLFAEDTQLP
jgi:hypothetical protein